ncbi:MAG: beta-glucosidase [Eubacterium sp.]|nr:beta-glucosidase [Eubacterium sp.]
MKWFKALKLIKKSMMQFLVTKFNLLFFHMMGQDMTIAKGVSYETPGMDKLCRQAAAEGCVLLQNNGVLPFKQGGRVAVFGRCQYDYFYVGYGSGGNVHAPKKVNLIDGLKNNGVKVEERLAEIYKTWCQDFKNAPEPSWWGNWPMHYSEMEVPDSLAKEMAEQCETAVVVIGRAAGEDRENVLAEGSYYLTKEEFQLLDTVTDCFQKTAVVMNCGSLIDLSWTERYADKSLAVLYAWQGGMESGNAVSDVLTGKVNPCGKLSDTVVRDYKDQITAENFGGKAFNHYAEDIFVGYRYYETFAPDQVQFPFGFGLSYTTFEIQPTGFSYEDGKIEITASVTNTGNIAGKEVVQVYLRAPQGKLGKAKKTLVSFGKTKLLAPGERQKLTFEIEEYTCASFDDTGKTGFSHSYVLEEGEYVFYIGASVRAEAEAGSFYIKKIKVLETFQEVCMVKEPFLRLVSDNGKPKYEEVPAGNADLKQRILRDTEQERRIPEDVECNRRIPESAGKYRLKDVASGKITMERFLAQLSDAELEALLRGEGGMGSALGLEGNAGVFGGILQSLRNKGVPPVTCCDGPAGIRANRIATLLPNGTNLACTWDQELITRLFEKLGEEMEHYGVDVLLSPGMNIHRNPLCGRNFEYYSEDPYLCGKIAACAVRGIQSRGASACPKHFACNNQEKRRTSNDSRVSGRALREIYLKGFEICVKEARPKCIMTSYNKINGVWSHYNYDLAATVLRKEWGFDGVVMTDWWMRSSVSPEFPKVKNNAYRIRSRVDVLMPGNKSRLRKAYKQDKALIRSWSRPDGITRREAERAAANVLRLALEKVCNSKLDA